MKGLQVMCNPMSIFFFFLLSSFNSHHELNMQTYEYDIIFFLIVWLSDSYPMPLGFITSANIYSFGWANLLLSVSHSFQIVVWRHKLCLPLQPSVDSPFCQNKQIHQQVYGNRVSNHFLYFSGWFNYSPEKQLQLHSLEKISVRCHTTG